MEGSDDGEGALLALLREKLGPTVPIVATLDRARPPTSIIIATTVTTITTAAATTATTAAVPRRHHDHPTAIITT